MDNAEIAFDYYHRTYTRYLEWRACQFDNEDNRDLVDEVFGSIVQRYFDNWQYWYVYSYQ